MQVSDDQHRGQTWLDFFLVTALSLALCLLWHRQIWPSLSSLYPGDSFHTLDFLPALGLAALTSIAALMLFAISWRATCSLDKRFKKHRWVVIGLDLVATAMLFWVLLSLAPQMFYAYYQTVIPGLPAQWVVQGLLPLNDYLTLLTLPPDATLASHAAGLTGWMLLCNKCIQWLNILRRN